MYKLTMKNEGRKYTCSFFLFSSGRRGELPTGWSQVRLMEASIGRGVMGRWASSGCPVQRLHKSRPDKSMFPRSNMRWPNGFMTRRMGTDSFAMGDRSNGANRSDGGQPIMRLFLFPLNRRPAFAKMPKGQSSQAED